MTGNVKPIYVDLPTVAAILSLSDGTVQKLVREEKFPKPRILSGRRVAWLMREVEAWAEGCPVSDLPPPPNTGHSNRRRATSRDESRQSPQAAEIAA